MSEPTIRIGTRGSALALRQAARVAEQVRALAPDRALEIIPVRTTGDHVPEATLGALGGKGLFVKELEEALLAGRVDIAVHSLKDMPAELPSGLGLAAFPPRDDPRDVLVSRTGGGIADLPTGATVGTGSLRRRVLLLSRRGDLKVEAIRGNVDTRLRRLTAGTWEAIVIAAAGLVRLGVNPANARALEPDEFIPAVGQGILALESRLADRALVELLSGLDHAATRSEAEAERAFLQQLGASCYTPIAAHARVRDGEVELQGLVASLDGRQVVRGRATGVADGAFVVGQKLAEDLRARGAGEILEVIRRERP